MLIIGEKINATRKLVALAIERRDEAHIIELAKSQVEAGADYIDINGASPREGVEEKNMQWLVELVQAATGKPVAVDTANPAAAKIGLSLAKGKKKPILNSVSLESERLEAMLPIIASTDCMVVGLCMSDEGTPTGVEDRVARAIKLVAKLGEVGKKPEEIIVDPCFFPISADANNARIVCDAIRQIREAIPGVFIGGGLSNCSYGLPSRRLINLAMISICTFNGMNAVIVDPCTKGVMQTIRAAEVASGDDEWCANYIGAHRQGKLE